MVQQTEGLQLSLKLITSYLDHLAAIGRSEGTRQTYRRKLYQLYELLPADKIIADGTLAELRAAQVAEGSPASTVNIFTAAANGLLDYSKRRDLQLPDALDQERVIAPELTRAEYLRLLSVARALERPRTYFLIKTLANTGLYIRELEWITVEAATAGRIQSPKLVHIPPALCAELLDFAQRSGIETGSIFVTGAGTPLSRSAVNTEIKRLAQDARVAEEKCNPLALRRLYLATQEQIMSGFTVLVEQSLDRLVETEQLSVGWD